MLRVKNLLTAGLVVFLSLTSQDYVQAGGHHGNGGGGNGGGGNRGGNGGGQFQMSRHQFSQNGNTGFRPQNVNFQQKNVPSHNSMSQPFASRVVSKVGPMSNGVHHNSNGNSSHGVKIVQGNQRLPNMNSNPFQGKGSGAMSHVKQIDGHFANRGQHSSFLNKNGFQGTGFVQSGSHHGNGKNHFTSTKFAGGSPFYKASKSFGGCYPNKYPSQYCGTSPWKSCGYGNGCWGYGGYGCNFGGYGYGYPTTSYNCGYNGYTCYYPSYGYGSCLYTPGCYGGISATILQPCVTTAYQCYSAPVYASAPVYTATQVTTTPIEMAVVNESLPPLSSVVSNNSSDMIPPAPSSSSYGFGTEDAKMVEMSNGNRGPQF